MVHGGAWRCVVWWRAVEWWWWWWRMVVTVVEGRGGMLKLINCANACFARVDDVEAVRAGKDASTRRRHVLWLWRVALACRCFGVASVHPTGGRRNGEARGRARAGGQGARRAGRARRDGETARWRATGCFGSDSRGGRAGLLGWDQTLACWVMGRVYGQVLWTRRWLAGRMHQTLSAGGPRAGAQSVTPRGPPMSCGVHVQPNGGRFQSTRPAGLDVARSSTSTGNPAGGGKPGPPVGPLPSAPSAPRAGGRRRATPRRTARPCPPGPMPLCPGARGVQPAAGSWQAAVGGGSGWVAVGWWQLQWPGADGNAPPRAAKHDKPPRLVRPRARGAAQGSGSHMWLVTPRAHGAPWRRGVAW